MYFHKQQLYSYKTRMTLPAWLLINITSKQTEEVLFPSGRLFHKSQQADCNHSFGDQKTIKQRSCCAAAKFTVCKHKLIQTIKKLID
jgi:hypothetical protein